jgi:hypothetical protein
MGEALKRAREDFKAKGRALQAAKRATNTESVIAALIDRPGSTRRQIAEVVGIHEITVGNILRGLVGSGRARRETTTRAGFGGNQPVLYYAVPDPDPAFRRGEGVPFHLPTYLTDPERIVLDAHDWSTPVTIDDLCVRTGLPRLSVLRSCRMLEMSEILQCAGDLWALAAVTRQPDRPGANDPAPDAIAAACRDIWAGWSDADWQARRVGGAPAEWTPLSRRSVHLRHRTSPPIFESTMASLAAFDPPPAKRPRGVAS